MNNEFKKIKNNEDTRYVLENASSGGTSSGSVASVSMPIGSTRKRGDNILAQEADKKTVPVSTPRNFVAKNAKTGGAGQHKDKKKAEKQGDVKHRKPFAEQGVAEGEDDKFSVANKKVEELVDKYRLYDKRGWTELFAKLAGRKLEVAEIRREMEYASKFLQLLDSIRMRSDYQGQQDPKEDRELIVLSNQWLDLFNKATSEFKAMSGQGVAEAAAPVTHRIGLTVTDPNHPMISKRGETYQKSVRVTGPDREAAINQAIAHHLRKGYKVHDHHYLGTVDQGVAEGFNGEYDDEAGMAHTNLLTSARAVMGLLKTINDKDNLPEWVQEKIAKAEMMLVGVWDYLQSQKEQGIDPQQDANEADERTMSRAAKTAKKESVDPYFESLRAQVEELAKK